MASYSLVPSSQPKSIDDPAYFPAKQYNYSLVPSSQPVVIDDPIYMYGYGRGGMPLIRSNRGYAFDDPFYGYGYGNFYGASRFGYSPYRNAVDASQYFPLSSGFRAYRPSASYAPPSYPTYSSMAYSPAKYTPPALANRSLSPTSADYFANREYNSPYGPFVSRDFHPHKGVMHLMNHVGVLLGGQAGCENPVLPAGDVLPKHVP